MSTRLFCHEDDGTEREITGITPWYSTGIVTNDISGTSYVLLDDDQTLLDLSQYQVQVKISVLSTYFRVYDDLRISIVYLNNQDELRVFRKSAWGTTDALISTKVKAAAIYRHQEEYTTLIISTVDNQLLVATTKYRYTLDRSAVDDRVLPELTWSPLAFDKEVTMMVIMPAEEQEGVYLYLLTPEKICYRFGMDSSNHLFLMYQKPQVEYLHDPDQIYFLTTDGYLATESGRRKADICYGAPVPLIKKGNKIFSLEDYLFYLDGASYYFYKNVAKKSRRIKKK